MGTPKFRVRPPQALMAAATEKLNELRKAYTDLGQEKDRLCAELEAYRRSSIAGMVYTLGKTWSCPEPAPRRSERSVDDPVHGRIVLDETLATILAHPIVQRLNHVKQLSFGYTQYPAATHTRLSHSLGAARYAELALAGILDRGVYYVDGERSPQPFEANILHRRNELIRKAKLAALVHDLGHGPFGHALDNYMAFRHPVPPHPKPEKPDKERTLLYVRTALAETLRSVGVDPAGISILLQPLERADLPGLDHLIADLIDSSLDVDRMDYLVRDAHMTGLMMGFTNTMALIDCMRAVRQGEGFTLAYDEGAIGYIEHFLLAREAMFFNCYEHPRKRAAERLLVRLVKHLVQEASLSVQAEDLFGLTDEELLSIVRDPGIASHTAKRLAECLVSDVEYKVVYEVGTGVGRGSPHEGDVPYQVEWWVKAASRPAMFHQIYVAQPEIWEEAIAQQSIGQGRSWQIQVILPSPEVFMQRDSGVWLLTKEGGRFKFVRLFDRSPRLKAVLEHFNSQRARIRVMAAADMSAAEQESIKRAAIELLRAEPLTTRSAALPLER